MSPFCRRECGYIWSADEDGEAHVEGGDLTGPPNWRTENSTPKRAHSAGDPISPASSRSRTASSRVKARVFGPSQG
jgi:hypothetical protein